jgi:hypothetical protein
MIENLIYPVIGFVGAFLGLEAAWHFTACRIPNNVIKACVYRQVKLAITKSA